MKFEFPDTGEGVTEGEFLEWLVEEGEEVEEDQVVAEAETDKAVVDIPAPADGTVEELRAKPGDTVEVGDVIMILDAGGGTPEREEEEADEGNQRDEQEDSETEAEQDEEPVESSETSEREVSSGQSSSGDVLALPKVRKLAEEKGVNLGSLGKEGRVTEEDVLEASDDGSADEEDSGEEFREESPEAEGTDTEEEVGVRATPAVRRLARQKEVELSGIDGSGRGGEVLREDVLEAAGEEKADSTGDKTAGRETPENDVERVEMSNVQRTAAEEVSKSRFTAPHVTHVEKADVEQLYRLREREKEEVDVHLTYLPFVLKAAQMALESHPDLNAELDEENDEIIRYLSYDFNIAVDTDEGLMAPVIEDVDDMSIVDLAEEIEEKAERARNRDLSPEELRNGTFSVTNLGAIGGEEFTPIITYPQVAILGVGSIGQTAEVVDGEVVPRHTVKLSLSYDHRVIDGATGARFMNELVENLENPEKLLMQL